MPLTEYRPSAEDSPIPTITPLARSQADAGIQARHHRSEGGAVWRPAQRVTPDATAPTRVRHQVDALIANEARWRDRCNDPVDPCKELLMKRPEMILFAF